METSNIIGNSEIKEYLANSIKSNNVLHSYLFLGTEGIGKRRLAENFAKQILCKENGEENCKCKSCICFDGKNHPDFNYINEQGEAIKIETIREVTKKVIEKPIVSEKKVYIINDCEKMTKEAQNCLLKTLEEPPEFVTIILIGSNENAFLTTIKSRCMIIRFNSVDNKTMTEYLQSQGIENVTENMLELFQGSIGKAIELKDKQEEYLKIEKMIENISNYDLIDVTKNAEILYQTKEEIMEMLDYINIVLLRLSRNNTKYTNCIKIVENTKKRLKQNANYDMCIDNLLFNMWEEIV